jgi:hypothetical protein
MEPSDLIEIRRPAAQTTPLVLDSPHSGSFYPDDFRPACGPEQYRRAEDMDVDVLFDAAAASGAVLLAARFGGFIATSTGRWTISSRRRFGASSAWRCARPPRPASARG